MRPIAALALCLCGLIAPTLASRGDRLPYFQECVENCIKDSCAPDSPNPLSIPLYLQHLAWTCPAECDYRCQHQTTAYLLESSQPVEQFHGKWPFHRILGAQELFSVLFSLLNLWAHWNGMRSLDRRLPESHPLRHLYRCFSYVGIWCWFWSAVFHTRDLLWTERMDYFGAGANVLYGLFLAPVRVFEGYYPPKKRVGSSAVGGAGVKSQTSEFKPWVYVWAFLCATGYICHIYYLSFVEWSYTYNMMANVVAGATGNLIWSYFSVRSFRRKGNARNLWPGLCVMWIVAAMGLELLDFPPIFGLIDAHSLWHLMTFWPTMWWYTFLLADARDVLGYEGLDLGPGLEETEMVGWKGNREE